MDYNDRLLGPDGGIAVLGGAASQPHNKRLRAKFEPRTGEYASYTTTNQSVVVSNQDEPQDGTTSHASVSQLLKRADRFVSSLFYANVLLSILNTLLLSLLVKTIQSDGGGGDHLLVQAGDGVTSGHRLGWNAHTESIELEWPASLRGGGTDRLLSVGTIQSNQDRPLIIEGANNEPRENSRDDGQILISAQSSLEAGHSKPQEANYILVPALRPPTSSQSARLGATRPATARRNARRPVEIVTNSLIVNQLSGDEGRPVTSKSLPPAAAALSLPMRGQSYSVDGQATSARSGAISGAAGQSRRQHSGGSLSAIAATTSSNNRRALELEGQTIVLPLANKIDLFPASARSLFVRDELRCGAGISGKLEDNFDVQARWSNLSFQSGRSLRIVSKSNKLDLAASRRLILEAPTLKLSVPRTHRVLVSTGIEFLADGDHHHDNRATIPAQPNGRPAKGGQSSAGSPDRASPSLESLALVLVDDILMAARD